MDGMSGGCIEVGADLSDDVLASLKISSTPRNGNSKAPSSSSVSALATPTAKPADFGLEGDCPLCYEALPPFWDMNKFCMICCGKWICNDCHRDMRFQDRNIYNKKIYVDGSKEDIYADCPLCRTHLWKYRGGDADATIESIEKIEANVEKGFAWAQYHLGMEHFRKRSSLTLIRAGQDQDEEYGFKLLRDAAEQGYPLAKYDIAELYYMHFRKEAQEGPSSQKSVSNISIAEKFLLELSEQGHADATYSLFTWCDNGKKFCPCCKPLAKKKEYQGKKNDTYYLKLAAEQGQKDASKKLADAYRDGTYGVEKSELLELKYYQRAADQGDAGAQLWCCATFYEGEHEDDEKFYHYSKLAAADGDPVSQYNMGMYYVVDGIKSEEFAIGMHYLREAASGGDEDAKSNLRIWDEYARRHCFNCHAQVKIQGQRFHKCAKCSSVAYCGKKCQKEHWHAVHKKICMKYKEWSWKLGR